MLEVPDLLLPEFNIDDSAQIVPLLRMSAEDQVQSSIKVSQVVPPEVNCHHVSAAGKNFLSIKVANVSRAPVILKEAQVLVNKNELQSSNQRLLNASEESSNAPQELSDVVNTVLVKIPMSQMQAMPFPLLQREEAIFLCNIEMQSVAQISSAKFQTDFEEGPASMRVQYHLPRLRLQWPSLVMLTECPSPVLKNHSFTVTYTIQNNLQDFMGISLAWIPSMPSHDASADETKYSAVNEVLVCQQPITHLGVCKKGSTVSAKVEFQALATGVIEVGKYMKLKLQYSIPAYPKSAYSSATLGTSSSLTSPSSRASSSSIKSSWCSSLGPPHDALSASGSHQYDIPVVEQASLGRPPFIRYLSQSQIKNLQAMKPRKKVSRRSQSYGGEVVPGEATNSRDINRSSLHRQASSNPSGGATFQRSRRSSYADCILKHPCQVYVVEDHFKNLNVQ